MRGLKIRYQQVGDAKRLFEILQHEDFIYFPASIASIEEEKAYLRKAIQDRRDGKGIGCSVLYRNKVVGAVGCTFHPSRPYVVEIGYFIDRAYWGEALQRRLCLCLSKSFLKSMASTGSSCSR